MSIYEEIKKDMVQAIKNKDETVKSLLRVLVSDIQRDPHKDYSDEKVVKVVKQTSKMLYENHGKFNKSQDLIDAEYLERAYLPKQVSDTTIIAFLNTLDFSKFKNKMQAIGQVTKHFPEGSVEGGLVKNIVMSYEI